MTNLLNKQNVGRHQCVLWINVRALRLLFSIAVLLNPLTTMAQHTQATPLLDGYFKMVFSGDISGTQELIKSHPNDHAAQMLKNRFEERFVSQSNGLDLSKLEGESTKQIARMFEAYWLNALLATAPIATLEEALKGKLDGLLVENGYPSAQDDEDTLLENVGSLIRQEGYFALSGRTPPLLELMIWTENEIEKTKIELTDGIYEVDVNFLDNFISYGWSNFATFGMTRTGGWAKEDGLYCICTGYDLTSERFTLSFLKHEGRHFADFKRFPGLKPFELEYRAKLTELVYSRDDIQALLAHFLSSANQIDNAPHPLANWNVIEDLSKHLFDGKRPADTEWQAIPAEKLQQTALLLLDEHNQMLNERRANITKSVVN